ncbi:MAG: hypothetical protein J0I92_12725, partial [Phyllobacterium sp.]|nr:hypothetical protein [Phyllobacterium sp.]
VVTASAHAPILLYWPHTYLFSENQGRSFAHHLSQKASLLKCRPEARPALQSHPKFIKLLCFR